MSRTIPVLQVDAFTSLPFAGNPAGVVLEADRLTDDEMKRIAREINAAETAFLTRTADRRFERRLRWFTPSGQEMAFCGHATVAAVYALDEAGHLRGDHPTFDTQGGALPVRVERVGSRRRIWLEPALPTCTPWDGALAEALAGLGGPALGSWARPALTSERDILLPMCGLAALRALRPDMSAIAALATAGGLRGICAVALEGVERASLTHARFFAPHLGIPEDPVTGSVHAAIPIWLWEAGAVSIDDHAVRFTAEQGDLVGRPGRLRLELALEGGRPARIRVGGEAVTTLRGTLRID